MLQPRYFLVSVDWTPDDTKRILVACTIVIVLLLIGYGVVNWIRKWIRSGDQAPASGFTLGDLRELRRSGKMTDEEFEKARALIVGAARLAPDRGAGNAGASPNRPPGNAGSSPSP